MFKAKIGSDTIQLGILLCAGLCMLGGFAAWCDTRYAKENEVSDMKEEIHQIYGKLIPQTERHQ